jgi:subtilisin-like proprotein convertase family protein
VDSPITVSGRSGNAPADASVTVNILHTYIGDLKVDLVATGWLALQHSQPHRLEHRTHQQDGDAELVERGDERDVDSCA